MSWLLLQALSTDQYTETKLNTRNKFFEYTLNTFNISFHFACYNNQNIFKIQISFPEICNGFSLKFTFKACIKHVFSI